jgi:MYXO-CTERM domain-containing protein
LAKCSSFVTFGVCAALALPSLAGRARARDDGLAVEDCSGCHSGSTDRVTTVTITPNSSDIKPGQTVRLSVAVSGASVSSAGLFFRTTPGIGQLALVSGEPTRLAGGGVVHSAPKSRSGSAVTFAIDWKAPAQAGDVEFLAYVIGANGDGRSTGDGYGTGYASYTFGCTGKDYYPDYDGDGYGGLGSPRKACSAPAQYAEQSGDCDDYDALVNPGASERCNTRDDNCDGRSDEGLTVQPYCADADGDGHGVRGGATKMDCGISAGFGVCDDDCDDTDKLVFPGATERCNYEDDNCNNRIDENARLTCGEGWCRRSSESCNASLCMPGNPVAEECNALDDDCDGEVDEEPDLCPARQVCVDGTCLPAAGVDAGARDAGTTRDAALRDAGAGDGATSEPTPRSDGGCRASTAGGSWLPMMLLALLTRRRRRLQR